jgi:hypothetical protein
MGMKKLETASIIISTKDYNHLKKQYPTLILPQYGVVKPGEVNCTIKGDKVAINASTLEVRWDDQVVKLKIDRTVPSRAISYMTTNRGAATEPGRPDYYCSLGEE